jgi:hypothetical protein
LIKRDRRFAIREIGIKVRETLDKLHAIMYNRIQTTRELYQNDLTPNIDYSPRHNRSETFTDRMMQTPFGRQYGGMIDKIIINIFDTTRHDELRSIPEDLIKEKTALLFQSFKLRSNMTKLAEETVYVVDYLLMQDYGIKSFAEKFLYYDRKETFSRFFSGQNMEQIDQFLTQVFTVYFEERFSSLFKIIKSMDMKKFACAFIIKRIYLREGENLTNFGYFFIRVIAKAGGIRSQ